MLEMLEWITKSKGWLFAVKAKGSLTTWSETSRHTVHLVPHKITKALPRLSKKLRKNLAKILTKLSGKEKIYLNTQETISSTLYPVIEYTNRKLKWKNEARKNNTRIKGDI